MIPEKRCPFPHCDQRVLHAPGECAHCDKYPDWQQLRKDWGIAFTNHVPAGDQWEVLPCPADFARGTGGAHVWHGNRPAKPCTHNELVGPGQDGYLPKRREPPFDGSPECPACPSVVRNLFAVAHNLVGRLERADWCGIGTRIQELKRAVEAVQPIVDKHFSNNAHSGSL